MSTIGIAKRRSGWLHGPGTATSRWYGGRAGGRGGGPRGGNGQTALYEAANNDHAGAVRSLAVRGGRAALDARDDDKRTPLHLAAKAEWGNTAVVQALLEAGADASLKDSDDLTALDWALNYGNYEVAARIRQGPMEARRLCGARQRLALATSMLASAEPAGGLDELPYDAVPTVGEAVAALGPPAAPVAIRALLLHQEEQEGMASRRSCYCPVPLARALENHHQVRAATVVKWGRVAVLCHIIVPYYCANSALASTATTRPRQSAR